MAKKIAILGAGACGLVAIKCCLDEDLEPVCFERQEELGGLWNFTERIEDDQGCVMRSTVINTSKEMMAYSDFPIPDEFPNFMHNTQVMQYFKMYADKFDLNKHIQYNKEMITVKRSKDYEQTGRWDVRVRDCKTGSEEILTFDGVLICSGHHATKHLPKFAGQEDFKGKMFHSNEYKDWTGYMGKRVVVIGIGNSGGDIAVELSRVGKVFLSTRRGSWIVNRIANNGLPGDCSRKSRFMTSVLKMIPRDILADMTENKLNRKFDHKLYSLQPKHRIYEQHPMVNDDLPNRIATGSITIKADVKRITQTGVEFTDGSFEDNIDVIILATGYLIGFPFLEKSVIDVKENRVELYKYMSPPDLSKHTLAIIGCMQPLGAIMPLAELQCRFATRVFKGLCRLPPREEMWEDVRKKEAAMARRYFKSQRHTVQVDYIEYMEEMAYLVGCRPNILKLMLADPKLGWKCYFGSCTPNQYRLMGPGAWSGARDAIMTQEDRMACPLKTRPLPDSVKKGKRTDRLFMLTVAIVMCSILLTFFLYFL